MDWAAKSRPATPLPGVCIPLFLLLSFSIDIKSARKKLQGIVEDIVNMRGQNSFFMDTAPHACSNENILNNSDISAEDVINLIFFFSSCAPVWFSKPCLPYLMK